MVGSKDDRSSSPLGRPAPRVETDIDEQKLRERRRMVFGPEPEPVSERDQRLAGEARQCRLDLFLDDPASLAKQADILAEFSRRLEALASDPNFTAREVRILVQDLARVCREELMKAAPSQAEKVIRRRAKGR